MPHFYGLSNNQPDLLPEEQKNFPETEINSIAYYLFRESTDYVAGKNRYRRFNDDRKKELDEKKQQKLASEKELKELEELTRRLEMDKKPVPLATELRDAEGKPFTLPPAAAGNDRAAQLKRGRRLFSERGCLACHSHQGTQKAEPEVPAVTGVAIFGPDLSRLKNKLNPEIREQDAKRRWLIQWIMDPKVYHPRTRMPVTFLDVGQATDVAEWLLSQDAQWDQQDVPSPTSEDLAKLARVYLLKAPGMTRFDADEILEQAGSNTRKGIASVSDLAPDADERELAAPIDDNKLRWYIGRKAITRLGCYGCHEIPGFSLSKPIGTPLNDWGKKDAERLAFEDIAAFIDSHYRPVDHQGKEVGDEESGKKPAIETFFADALKHHQREGFLYQKLNEPRSYDYNRVRTWDDRLRMPQFQFARGKAKPKEGETQEQADYREEAEAREAVMTFVLGLVAEPVPAQYLYKALPDRMAEVKGRHVLEKYNCIGCHQVRAGVYEFKRSPAVLSEFEDKCYQKNPKKFASEYHDAFAEQNEWTGRPSPVADRLIGYGVPDPADENSIRLTEALRFNKKPEDIRNREDNSELPPGNYDVPASVYVGVPRSDYDASEPYGGTFAELMLGYLKLRTPTLYGDYKTARAALPPPLMREGEKAQPSWLFQFLRNPQQVRRATILRMPRFNMNDEEAMALVNYFAGVDRMNNPGDGLNYPYLAIEQRDEEFWTRQSLAYLDRIKKDKPAFDKRVSDLQGIWNLMLDAQVAELKSRVASAQAAVANAKDAEAKKQAETGLAALQKELAQLQNEAGQKKGPYLDNLVARWGATESYATDGYRLLANYNTPCLGCHQIGTFAAKNALHEQGPPLDITWERLRPEWTRRWIANPDRLISYPTPMPQNFPRDKVDARGMGNLYPEFIGDPLQQVTAVRDILMFLPKVAELPENRTHRPAMEQKEVQK
jgi:cytochrome c2